MASEKRSSLGRTMRNLISLVPNLIAIVSNITTLINLEARLAGRALLFLITLAVVSAILIMSLWMCLLAMLVVYLLSVQWSLLASLAVVLVLNIIFFVVVTIMMAKAKKHLLFPATVQECREIQEYI